MFDSIQQRTLPRMLTYSIIVLSMLLHLAAAQPADTNSSLSNAISRKTSLLKIPVFVSGLVKPFEAANLCKLEIQHSTQTISYVSDLSAASIWINVGNGKYIPSLTARVDDDLIYGLHTWLEVRDGGAGYRHVSYRPTVTILVGVSDTLVASHTLIPNGTIQDGTLQLTVDFQLALDGEASNARCLAKHLSPSMQPVPGRARESGGMQHVLGGGHELQGVASLYACDVCYTLFLRPLFQLPPLCSGLLAYAPVYPSHGHHHHHRQHQHPSTLRCPTGPLGSELGWNSTEDACGCPAVPWSSQLLSLLEEVAVGPFHTRVVRPARRVGRKAHRHATAVLRPLLGRLAAALPLPTSTPDDPTLPSVAVGGCIVVLLLSTMGGGSRGGLCRRRDSGRVAQRAAAAALSPMSALTALFKRAYELTPVPWRRPAHTTPAVYAQGEPSTASGTTTLFWHMMTPVMALPVALRTQDMADSCTAVRELFHWSLLDRWRQGVWVDTAVGVGRSLKSDKGRNVAFPTSLHRVYAWLKLELPSSQPPGSALARSGVQEAMAQATRTAQEEAWAQEDGQAWMNAGHRPIMVAMAKGSSGV